MTFKLSSGHTVASLQVWWSALLQSSYWDDSYKEMQSIVYVYQLFSPGRLSQWPREESQNFSCPAECRHPSQNQIYNQTDASQGYWENKQQIRYTHWSCFHTTCKCMLGINSFFLYFFEQLLRPCKKKKSLFINYFFFLLNQRKSAKYFMETVLWNMHVIGALCNFLDASIEKM